MCLIMTKAATINISSQISSILEEKNISQQELSNISKISLERIVGFIKGTIIPSNDELLTITKTFNISVNSILSGITHSIECTNKNCIYNNKSCMSGYIILDDLGQCIHHNIDVPKFGHTLNKIAEIKNEHNITCNELKCEHNINRKCILNELYINTVGQCEEFKWRKNSIG